MARKRRYHCLQCDAVRAVSTRFCRKCGSIMVRFNRFGDG